MAQVTMVLTGDKKLNRILNRLPKAVNRRIVRKAARPALKPVAADARQRAPVGESGRLKAAIKVRALRRTRRRVGARLTIGEKSFVGKTFYGGFQEWGWRIGRRGTSGRRKRAGVEFLQNAAKAQENTAIKIYRKGIRDGILAEARRS